MVERTFVAGWNDIGAARFAVRAPGYRSAMTTDPKLPESDESDNEEAVTTPAGQVGEIEEMIEETDAEVVPDD